MKPFILDPLARAAFNQQGVATMGIDAAWDRAVSNLIACDIKARVQEEFGAAKLALNEDGIDERDAERRLGAKWREHPEGKPIWERCLANGRAYDQAINEQFYEPLWEAQRQFALTPAPSLAAALWKAAVIEIQEIWNDGPLNADCVAIIDADLARFVATEGEAA